MINIYTILMFYHLSICWYFGICYLAYSDFRHICLARGLCLGSVILAPSQGDLSVVYAGLIARSFSAVSPRIATRSASFKPGVARMWSTAVLVQGNG